MTAALAWCGIADKRQVVRAIEVVLNALAAKAVRRILARGADIAFRAVQALLYANGRGPAAALVGGVRRQIERHFLKRDRVTAKHSPGIG